MNAEGTSNSGDIMAIPDGHISVTHGNLVINVPRNIFKGNDVQIDEILAGPFKEMVRGRYPWLTENSMTALMNSARKEMVRVRDEETHGRSVSKDLESQGKIEDAVKHLKRHLEGDPNDADSWYALGELLCKAGRPDEGYKAFARGRDLF